MKSYLSGMPECKFGMNDKLLIDKQAKPSTAEAQTLESQLAKKYVTSYSKHCALCSHYNQFNNNIATPPAPLTVMRFRPHPCPAHCNEI